MKILLLVMKQELLKKIWDFLLERLTNFKDNSKLFVDSLMTLKKDWLKLKQLGRNSKLIQTTKHS